MNLAETLRGLWRRWYIVIPGLILAVAVAFSAWFVVRPGYERIASQLLLPGSQSIPVDANPFLYLGGLSNAADVLVRAVGSENVMAAVAAEYPRADVEVTRDTSTSGPVILTKVTGTSDAEASAVIGVIVAKTSEVLNSLQDAEQIPVSDRITVVPISIDDQSILQQKNRILAAAGAGLATAALAIVAAAFADGLILQRRRRVRSKNGRPDEGVSDEPVSDPDEADDTFNSADSSEPQEDAPEQSAEEDFLSAFHNESTDTDEISTAARRRR